MKATKIILTLMLLTSTSVFASNKCDEAASQYYEQINSNYNPHIVQVNEWIEEHGSNTKILYDLGEGQKLYELSFIKSKIEEMVANDRQVISTNVSICNEAYKQQMVETIELFGLNPMGELTFRIIDDKLLDNGLLKGLKIGGEKNLINKTLHKTLNPGAALKSGIKETERIYNDAKDILKDLF